MATFIVTDKLTGAETYRYSADTPIEWVGMEFVTHHHAVMFASEEVTDVPVVAMTWTKLEYLRRFTQDERIAIRTAAKQVPALDDYLELLALATEVRSDDPDIVGALAMLEAGGLIGAGRAQEILQPPTFIKAATGAVSNFPITHRITLAGSLFDAGVSTDGRVWFADGRWSNVESLASMGATLEQI